MKASIPTNEDSNLRTFVEGPASEFTLVRPHIAELRAQLQGAWTAWWFGSRDEAAQLDALAAAATALADRLRDGR